MDPLSLDPFFLVRFADALFQLLWFCCHLPDFELSLKNVAISVGLSSMQSLCMSVCAKLCDLLALRHERTTELNLKDTVCLTGSDAARQPCLG
jgi:hypothetical protein